MLKKKLGTEAIEEVEFLHNYFKIPSSLVISERCETIKSYAFHGCNRLKEVVISKNVKDINVAAFYNCTSLRKVVIPRSVDWVGSNVFCNCVEAVIIIEKSKCEFNYIGTCAFDDCKIVEYAEEKIRY